MQNLLALTNLSCAPTKVVNVVRTCQLSSIMELKSDTGNVTLTGWNNKLNQDTSHLSTAGIELKSATGPVESRITSHVLSEKERESEIVVHANIMPKNQSEPSITGHIDSNNDAVQGGMQATE
ncbi:hypothetical protein DPMN_019973 [Dreissena polymorpha]|uniref:Uncharacterized protein n=1 Tax=Dreissena polymorpha TaxID=45954 RepID=A0A9D4NJE0_DREPO|nr:hypothetical protein DPMN_019973 [Dreissena polymorpha]